MFKAHYYPSTYYKPYKITKLSNIPFDGRDSAVCRVLGSKAYLFGGWNPDTVPSSRVDFWEFDGTTWTQKTNVTFSPTLEACCVVLNNKIHVIGVGTDVDQHWSFDGTTWVLEEDDLAFMNVRYGYCYGVIDNAIVIFGGRNRSDSVPRIDIWKSNSSGVSFTNVGDTPFSSSGVTSYQCPTLGSKMGLLGGGVFSSTLNTTVWTTTNGINWTNEAAFPTRGTFWPNCEVFDNKVFYIGGYDDSPSGEINDTYYSSDWVNWTRLDDAFVIGIVPLFYKPIHAGVTFILNNAMYYTTGRSFGVMHQEIYKFELI